MKFLYGFYDGGELQDDSECVWDENDGWTVCWGEKIVAWIRVKSRGSAPSYQSEE